MFGWVFGLKGIAIAAAIAFVAGGVAGIDVEKKLSDAARYKALTAAYAKAITTLKGQISTTNAAAKADQDRAAQAERDRAAAQENADVLKASLKDGVCFDDADAGQLRQLWTGRRSNGAAARSTSRP